MKEFIIKLKSGLSGTLEATDREDLFKKIGSGHYSFMSIRGRFPEIITEESIEEIIEEA